MNSPKSIVPLLLVSKVLKMFLLKLSAFPLGKIFEYISTNCSLVSSPEGQSLRKPSYHPCQYSSEPLPRPWDCVYLYGGLVQLGLGLQERHVLH